MKRRLALLINPLDATRYIEFPFILKTLKQISFNLINRKVLDVSSPYILSYIFSRKTYVIKTDINPHEKEAVGYSDKIKFQEADACALSFNNEQFDFVYAISVIEHIYNDYYRAIREIIRVTKIGGIIYISFPISDISREEWIDKDIYSQQYADKKGVFFQYVFDQQQTKDILNLLQQQCEIINMGLYADNEYFNYDTLVLYLRSSKKCQFLCNALANLVYGLSISGKRIDNFKEINGIGTACVVVRRLN